MKFSFDLVLHTSAELKPLSLFIHDRGSEKAASKDRTLIERFPQVYNTDQAGLIYDRSPMILVPRIPLECCCRLSVYFGSLLRVHDSVYDFNEELTCQTGSEYSRSEIAKRRLDWKDSFRTMDGELFTPISLSALPLCKILKHFFSDWKIVYGTKQAFDAWRSGFPLCKNMNSLAQTLGLLENKVDSLNRSGLSKSLIGLFDDAKNVARRFNHEYIGSEHVIVAMAERDALKILQIPADELCRSINELVQHGPFPLDVNYFPIAPKLKEAFEFARQLAHNLGHEEVCVDHLVYGMCCSSGVGSYILAKFMSIDLLKSQVIASFKALASDQP